MVCAMPDERKTAKQENPLETDMTKNLEMLKAADSARKTGMRYAEIGNYEMALLFFASAHTAEKEN